MIAALTRGVQTTFRREGRLLVSPARLLPEQSGKSAKTGS
jgi:hypothetical protein